MIPKNKIPALQPFVGTEQYGGPYSSRTRPAVKNHTNGWLAASSASSVGTLIISAATPADYLYVIPMFFVVFFGWATGTAERNEMNVPQLQLWESYMKLEPETRTTIGLGIDEVKKMKFGFHGSPGEKAQTQISHLLNIQTSRIEAEQLAESTNPFLAKSIKDAIVQEQNRLKGAQELHKELNAKA